MKNRIPSYTTYTVLYYIMSLQYSYYMWKLLGKPEHKPETGERDKETPGSLGLIISIWNWIAKIRHAH